MSIISNTADIFWGLLRKMNLFQVLSWQENTDIHRVDVTPRQWCTAVRWYVVKHTDSLSLLWPLYKAKAASHRFTRTVKVVDTFLISRILKCKGCRTASGCYIMLLYIHRSYFHGTFQLLHMLFYLVWDLKPLLGGYYQIWRKTGLLTQKWSKQQIQEREQISQVPSLFSLTERYFKRSNKCYESEVRHPGSCIHYNLKKAVITESLYQRYKSCEENNGSSSHLSPK